MRWAWERAGGFLGLRNLLRENCEAVVINGEQMISRRENDKHGGQGQGKEKRMEEM